MPNPLAVVALAAILHACGAPRERAIADATVLLFLAGDT